MNRVTPTPRFATAGFVFADWLIRFAVGIRCELFYGRRSTCPGLILSGSVNWSLFSSKIFM